MITLDRRVTAYFPSITVHSEGMYPYTIKRRITSGTTEDIFVGNFYYNGSDTRLTFDITDIVASDGFVITEDSIGGIHCMKNHLADKYTVVITWGANDTSSSITPQWVAKVSTYHNKDLIVNMSATFFDPDGIGNGNKWSILMQGFKKTNSTSVLPPHYPMYPNEDMEYSNDCPFFLSLLVGDAVTGITSVFVVDSFKQQRTIPASGNSFTYVSTLANVADYSGITPTTDGVLKLGATISEGTYLLQIQRGVYTYIYARYPQGDEITDYQFPYCYVLVNNSQNKSITDSSLDYTNVNTNSKMYAIREQPAPPEYVYDYYDTTPDVQYYDIVSNYLAGAGEIIGGYDAAIFDVCPKKYYLIWQDRFGSFQCQGFSEYANYSEEYDKTEVQDYQNRRRDVNVQIQSKWKLYSGWIPEELYPFYESIYTSQFTMLFDVERNTYYTVMVNGNYEEKTYKNQKRLINMNLELEENKKQSIIY